MSFVLLQDTNSGMLRSTSFYVGAKWMLREQFIWHKNTNMRGWKGRTQELKPGYFR